MIRQHELLTEVAGWIAEGHIQPTLTEALSPITARQPAISTCQVGGRAYDRKTRPHRLATLGTATRRCSFSMP
ncbi:MAG: hypothetical protein AB7T38_05870 [Nitrospirales bacterium]